MTHATLSADLVMQACKGALKATADSAWSQGQDTSGAPPTRVRLLQQLAEASKMGGGEEVLTVTIDDFALIAEHWPFRPATQ